MLKVSIIIPAYNAVRFIRQTIESVLAQTFQDFEIIVVDDGSSDKTADIARSFGEPVYCIQKPNGGVSRARNTGIGNAKGEYIAFLDADDLWQPTKLEKQVALLDAASDVGLCFASTERINENNETIGYIEGRDYADFSEALLLYLCIVSGSCSSAMVRKELLLQIGGFDSRLTNYEDWDCWLRLSLITRFASISEYLVKCRTVAESASFNTVAAEKNMQEILSKFYNLPDLPARYKKIRNKSYSNNWMILSGDYLSAGKYGDSLRCLIKGLNLHPQNIVRPLGLPIRLTKRLLAGKHKL